MSSIGEKTEGEGIGKKKQISKQGEEVDNWGEEVNQEQGCETKENSVKKKIGICCYTMQCHQTYYWACLMLVELTLMRV